MPDNPHPPHWRRRRWLLLALLALAVGGAVVVGRAATGGGSDFTIAGDAAQLLQPGATPERIDLAFSNPNAFELSVSDLAVSIVSVDAPAARAGLPCTIADFAVTQFSGAYPFTIPAGASTLASTGRATATWPTVALVETNRNQDGCQGATVHLGYQGSAFNPDQPVEGQPGPAAPATTTTVTTTTLTPPIVTTPVITRPTAPLSPPASRRGSLGLTIVPTVQFLQYGGKATFRIAVRNNSSGKLAHVSVSDPVATACNRAFGPLAAGAVRAYTCVRPKALRSFTNTATASGETAAGRRLSVTASARVQVAPPRARLAIRALPGRQTITTTIVTRRTAAGATTSIGYGGASFRIRVANTGNVALRRVGVGDRLAPDCNRRLGTLAPGATRTYRCVAIGIRRGFTNVARVHGTSAAGGASVSAVSRSRVAVRIARTTVGRPAHQAKFKLEVVLTIPDVLFAFNRAEILEKDTRVLATILVKLQQHYAGRQLTITGYTDSVGTTAYNLDLSRRRAAAVAAWLTQHGFPRGAVSIAWKGEADPVASNDTPAGRQQNRRVTITVEGAGR